MSKKTTQKAIQVCAHWVGLKNPALMGTLFATPSRGKEVFSFVYEQDWLKSGPAQALDPSLLLTPGHQYAPQDQGNFGIFLDSSPDRWGRRLMERREAQRAREEKREPRSLVESDYLLGVFDGHRMGAIRFRLSADGPFLDDDRKLASPPWASLRELENASLELEKDEAERDPNYSKWISLLIAPGASLGGARPKASVLDAQGGLWIAKFPSRSDDYDVGAWEMVVKDLAEKAGVVVAEATAKKFSSRYHTFLTRRFDRTSDRCRIHFASAMTLLQRNDGDDGTAGASYLELAGFILQQGANPDRDLEQLWRRIVFFICVSNLDDHLRNHGFLLTPNGWALAPAYDINPSWSGDALVLNISETDNSQSLDLALENAKHFRIKSPRAKQIVVEVQSAAKAWRKMASRAGISSGEQDRMARAFRFAEAK